MMKTFKYRIYPNKKQREMFSKHFGCTRFVYNWGLNEKKTAYENGETNLSFFDLCKKMKKLKQELKWLKEVNSQSLQASLRNLDDAFRRFFRKQNGYPKFKAKHCSVQSFQCPQHVSIVDGKLNLPKIKKIKIKQHRIFDGKIKTVTICKTPADKYYASILIENDKKLPEKIKPTMEESVGVDLGLSYFATLSTGEKIDNPRHLKKSQNKLKKEQRRLAKKKKKSSNRSKQRKKVALVYEKISNQRKDFLHKLSKRLVDENQAVCLEDLNVSGMLKNRYLSKSISDVGWRMFRTFCEYKADWYGKNTLIVGRFEATTKACSCNTKNDRLTLSDRIWTCSVCNLKHDRDILAANNILKFAFIPQGLRDVKPVETL